MTFGDLKTAIRANLPFGAAGEAPNLVAAHNKLFVDCLIDLQMAVVCLQSDNTSIFPQCATFYNCGFTVFPKPRGFIKKVSVIDKINPTTHKEDPTAADDYCSEIPYTQVDACHIHRYLAASRRAGCCFPTFAFLGCSRTPPVPTDAGLPAGLPVLPLGFHYPQTSTDRVSASGDVRWRAHMGIWAIERGKIWMSPWIQSTESVLVVWDGIKRTWGDTDTIDDDPLLAEALESYVRWKHAENYDHDYEAAAAARLAYEGSPATPGAKQKLIKQCRDETRVRECEPSFAQSSASSLTALFYNDEQSGTASCPDGTGSVSSTVPAGTVASTISVADANQRAKAQAISQAQAQLNCGGTDGGGGQTFANTNAGQMVTVSCDWDGVSPVPDGNPVSVPIPSVTSSVSVADANNTALALATASARALLSCTYWNAAQTYTATCSTNQAISVTKVIAARTYSSTVSQADANSKALTAAQNQAEAALPGAGCGATVYGNTQQKIGPVSYVCHLPPGIVVLTCTVLANTVNAATQAEANFKAQNLAIQYMNMVQQKYCATRHYGTFVFNYGSAPP